MGSKKVSQEEMAGVLSTDGPTRYHHFVKQVADWQLVWGLRGEDGWVSMGASTEEPAFPVWPHEAYAKLSAVDEWTNAQPTLIEVQIAVFPTPAGKSVLVDPERLRSDIEMELSRVE
jgi:hypothetical protein